MKNLLIVIQIILSITLTVLIFLQANEDSDSRGNIMTSTTFQKRGWEKIIFYISLAVLILFILSSIVQTII